MGEEPALELDAGLDGAFARLQFVQGGFGAIDEGFVVKDLAATFASYPNKAFSIGELCCFVWPSIKPRDFGHKHRTAVSRAVVKVPAAGWKWFRYMCGIEKVVYAGQLATEHEVREARRRFARIKCCVGSVSVPAQHLPNEP